MLRALQLQTFFATCQLLACPIAIADSSLSLSREVSLVVRLIVNRFASGWLVDHGVCRLLCSVGCKSSPLEGWKKTPWLSDNGRRPLTASVGCWTCRRAPPRPARGGLPRARPRAVPRLPGWAWVPPRISSRLHRGVRAPASSVEVSVLACGAVRH